MWPSPPGEAAEIHGVSHGVPWSRRGHIAIDAAGFTQESGNGSLLALGLDVHIPVARTTFIDARLPMAGIYPGNIMLGADHVAKLGRAGFLTFGGQLGLPLVTNGNAVDFSLPNGTWNVHEYDAHFMPIKLHGGYERATKLLEIRLDLEPILLLPVGNSQEVNFIFQHAAELQFGHTIGGGLRAQGVAVTSGVFDDAYQFSVEPFLIVRRKLGFARIGLMLPLDESVAGPAFEQAWGLRLFTGMHID